MEKGAVFHHMCAEVQKVLDFDRLMIGGLHILPPMKSDVNYSTVLPPIKFSGGWKHTFGCTCFRPYEAGLSSGFKARISSTEAIDLG